VPKNSLCRVFGELSEVVGTNDGFYCVLAYILH
jgi:hypothetical protein